MEMGQGEREGVTGRKGGRKERKRERKVAGRSWRGRGRVGEKGVEEEAELQGSPGC